MKNKEGCGGRCDACSHDTIARSTPKNVSEPCQRCRFEFGVFHMEGHPDDGMVFACSFSGKLGGLNCTYFQPGQRR